MTTPAWFLLIWCGLAATCVAAAAGAAIGGTQAAWSLAPAPRSRIHGLLWSLIAGVFVYPALYGITFEALHRADFRTGLLLGVIHGAAMATIARRSALVRGAPPVRAALRAGIMHAIYGAIIAFLYVTP